MLAANYRSGDDFVVEFLGHRFEFSRDGLRGARHRRRRAARARSASNDVDEHEAADLVELVADGRIGDPRSGLGLYLVRHWERVSLAERRVARLLAAEARLPRRLARPPREGGAPRRVVDRRHGRLRLRRAAGRAHAPRARARSLLARAPVPRLRRPPATRSAARDEAERPLGVRRGDLDRATAPIGTMSLRGSSPSSRCGMNEKKPNPGSALVVASVWREPSTSSMQHLGLLEPVLARERRDHAREPLDELVERAGRARCPDVRRHR